MPIITVTNNLVHIVVLILMKGKDSINLGIRLLLPSDNLRAHARNRRSSW